jgi:hypothetical protein
MMDIDLVNNAILLSAQVPGKENEREERSDAHSDFRPSVP